MTYRKVVIDVEGKNVEPQAAKPDPKVVEKKPEVKKTVKKDADAPSNGRTVYSNLSFDELIAEVKARGLYDQAKDLTDSEKGRRELRTVLRKDDEEKGTEPHLTEKSEINWKPWLIALGILAILVLLIWGGGNAISRKLAVASATDPRVTTLETEVSSIKTDLTSVKSDVAEVKVDLTGIKTSVEEGFTKVMGILNKDPETTTNTTEVPVVAEEPVATTDTEDEVSYKIFDPIPNWDWDKISKEEKPTFVKFLEDHDLTTEDIQEYNPPAASWEPAIYVVELIPELYGNKSIPLVEGYIYSAALSDGTIIDFWGGDEEIPEVELLWGFTARWVDPYLDLPYKWLNPSDPTEFVVRENRFGRYRRSLESGLPGLPYFERFGPYQTLAGNVLDWDPPSLDAVAPRDYRDAAAMLGGLAVESEWSTDGVNWKWVYSEKVSGSGGYCKQGMPCSQTAYIPSLSTGYIELWNGELGAPTKFYSNQLDELLSGRFNVDEFSYHPYGD